MKIEQTAMIDYDEVDARFRLKLPMLFQRLQRAAIHHSECVGLGPQAMVKKGGVWILNRMLVEIYRMPAYREELTVQTWHKGPAGFRTGRAFILSCRDETVCAVESRWLYFDLKKRRIVKIPEQVSEPFTTEQEDALDKGAIDFPVDRKFEPEQVLSLTTRAGDYDSNGHVNNTVYLEYLDTLIKRNGIGTGSMKSVGIQYIKEIGLDVQTLHAGASRSGDVVKFGFFNGSTVYAAGCFTARGSCSSS